MRLWWGEWLIFLDDAKMLRGSAVWRVVGSLGTIRMIEDLDMLWWCVVGGEFMLVPCTLGRRSTFLAAG